MPLGAGRKFDSAWCEVLKIESSSKVNCKHCNAEISGKFERIKVHHEKCLKQTTTSVGDTESANDAAIPSSEQPSTSNDGRGTGAANASAKLRFHNVLGLWLVRDIRYTVY